MKLLDNVQPLRISGAKYEALAIRDWRVFAVNVEFHLPRSAPGELSGIDCGPHFFFSVTETC